MAGQARFGSVVTAMVTPFDEDGELDGGGATRLGRWLADQGTDALVLAGSTGEATVLSDSEKIELWRCLAEAVTIPVIAGVGTADTRHSVELARAAETAGVAAVLAVTPYYGRPPQAGIARHFEAVAGATALPVMLYDIPVRTGRRLAPDTVLRLARSTSNIVALKYAVNDLPAAATLAAAAPAGFDLYSGDSSLTLPLLAVGAVGLVGVASHWSGPEHAEMVAAFHKGDVDGAREANARLLESYEFESSEEAPNPMPVKAMLRVMGLPAGQCRLPLGPAPESLEHRARSVLGGLRRSGREAREPEVGGRGLAGG